MAIIKNIVETRFTSQGAKSTANQTETLTRAQTRLAQSSASAGRVFSSQAKGLGGLVAAYAGAAATTYALQQAFSKLSAAARSLQALEGLSTLAAKTAQDASKIIASIDSITKSQMSLAQSTETLGLSLSSGFNKQQITGLATVAKSLGAVLGKDVAGSFDRLVKSAAKLTPTLLQELGIFPKLDTAVKSYAIAIGKNAKALNEYERRQAYVNAIIEEGERKFKSASSIMPSASEQFQKLTATVRNMTDAFTETLVNALMPFVEFVNKHAVAAMSAFMIMASMVAGKALSEFRTALDGIVAAIGRAAAGTENFFRKFTGITSIARDASKSLRFDMPKSLVLDEDDARHLKIVSDIAKERSLTNEEMRIAQTLLVKNSALQQEIVDAAQKEVTEAEKKTKELLAQNQASKDRIATLREEEKVLRQTAELPAFKDYQSNRAQIESRDKKIRADLNAGTKNLIAQIAGAEQVGDMGARASENMVSTARELANTYKIEIQDQTKVLSLTEEQVKQTRRLLSMYREMAKARALSPGLTAALRSEGVKISNTPNIVSRLVANEAEQDLAKAAQVSKSDITRSERTAERARDNLEGIREEAQKSEKATSSILSNIENVLAHKGASIAEKWGNILRYIGTGLTYVASGFNMVFNSFLRIFSFVSIITAIGSSVAALVGYGEEFDAVVKKVLSGIGAIFGTADKEARKKAFYSLAMGAIEELEKVDVRLQEIEEFKFTSKILWFDVMITKSKEDMAKEVSEAMNQAQGMMARQAAAAVGVQSDIDTLLADPSYQRPFSHPDTMMGRQEVGIVEYEQYLQSLGKTLAEVRGNFSYLQESITAFASISYSQGIPVSQALMEVITAAGVATENLLTVQQAALADSLLGTSGAFSAPDSVGANMAAKILIEQLGTAAQLSLEAREYLRYQLQIIQAQQGQITNAMELQRLADLTGSSASEMGKSFNVAISANVTTLTRSLGTLRSGFMQVTRLADSDYIQNLDHINENLNAKSIPGLLQGTGIDVTAIEKAILATNGLVHAVRDLQDQTIRTDNVVETFYEDFASGSLDLASMEQQWSETQAAVEDFRYAILTSEGDLGAVASAFDSFSSVVGSNSSILSGLSNHIGQINGGLYEAGLNAELFEQQIDDIRATVENTIRALTSAERILSTFSGEVKLTEFNFGTFRDSSMLTGGAPEIATNEAKELEHTFERLSVITANNGALFDRNLQRQKDIHYFAEQNNLTREQEQSLLSATDFTIGTTIEKIARGNGQLETALRYHFQIGALSTEQLALVEETDAAYKAQIGFLLQTITAAQKYTDELNKQTKEIREQITQLQISAELEQLKADLKLTQAANTAETDIAKELLELDKQRVSLLEQQLSLHEQTNKEADNALARQNALSQAILDRENAVLGARRASIELLRQANSISSSIFERNINREIGQIDTNFDGRLREAINQGGDLGSIMADVKRVIDLQAGLYENQARNMYADYVARKELLDMEYAQTVSALDNERANLELEQATLNNRIAATREEANIRQSIEASRIAAVQAERALEDSNTQRELELVAQRETIARAQFDVDSELLQRKVDADILADNAALQEIQQRYALLSAQNSSNQNFLNAFAALLTEAQRQMDPNAAEITAGNVLDTYQPEIDAAQSALNDIIASRNELYELQRTNLSAVLDGELALTEIDRDKLTQQQDIAVQRRAAEDESFARTAELRAREAQQEIDTAENTVAILALRYDELTQNRLAADDEYKSKVLALYAEIFESISSMSENAHEAMRAIPNSIRDLVTSYVAQYKKQIDDIRASLREIRDENVLIRLNFEIDMRSLKRDYIQSSIEAAIENLQLQVQLVEAQKDAKNLSAADAAVQINALNQQLLTEQKKLITQEYNNRKAALGDQYRILEAEVKINQERIRADIELQKADIQNNINYLNALAMTYDNYLTSVTETNNNFLNAEAQTFNSFLMGLASTLNGMLRGFAGIVSSIPDVGNVGFSAISPGAVTVQEAERGSQVIAEAMDEHVAAAMELTNLLDKQSDILVNQEQTRLDQARERLMIEGDIARVDRDRAAENLALERAIEDQKAQSRLNDAGGGGGKGDNNKTQDLIDDIMQTIYDTMESLKSALMDLVSGMLQEIGKAVTAVQQASLAAAEASLEIVSDITSYINDRLSTAQASLNESLEQEKTLREELIDQTKELTEAHKKYTDAFSFEDNGMVAASAEFIERLWDQKETMLDLSQATRKSVALSKEEKSLLKIQISQTEQLKIATEERNAAEAKLEKTQNMLTFASDLLSGSFTALSDKLLEVGQTAAAVMEMLGMTSGAGLSYASPINSIFGQFSGPIKDLGKQIKELQTARAAGGGVPSNFTGSGSQYDASLGTASNIAGGLGGAMTGFSIGSSISQLVGDAGWATTIGGTLGGAAAGFFAPAITSFIGSIAPSLVTGMMGSILGMAIPIVGSIIGALLGSLFKKTPRMSASGTLTGSDFSIDRLSASGGAKMSSAKSAGNLMSEVFGNITSTLEQVGIEFTGVVKSSIKAVKKNITAIITMDGQTIRKGVSGGEEAAKFFIDQFFKNVQFEDLKFDELAQGISVIKTVVKQFTEVTAKSERTAERFSDIIEFAQNFDKTIAELIGTGTTTVQVFEMLEKAAIANSYALATFYRKGIEQAADYLGEASAEYAEYAAAIRHNALAQIGLTEVMVNGTMEFISIADAMKDLDAGAIAIRNIVSSLSSMGAALQAAGITDSTVAISFAINAALKDMVLNIRDNMQGTLDILRDPAKAIVPELRGIVDNSKSITKELVGQYDQVLKEIENGADIQNGIVVNAWNNIGLSQELGYEKTIAYLRGLNEAQLEAAVNSDILAGATQEMAEILLASARLISSQKAVASLISSSRQIKEAIASVTGVFVGIDWNGIMAIGPDFGTLAEALGGQNVDGLTANLGEMINNVAAGRNVVTNFTSAGELLIEKYEDGTIKVENMSSAFEHLSEVTTNYLNDLKTLISAYEDSMKQISDMLNNARKGVLSALEQLKDTIVNSIQQTVTTSQAILKIFDDTLSGVAKSGNELFDLQDKARASLADSSKAVLEFERANQLSGKSVAQTTAELDAIANQIAALSNIDAVDFGLSEFLELSRLMSQQRFLQNELKTLSSVEGEYKELLDKRTSAQDDLAYVESTILGLGDSLIDTRRQESDLIQKTQDATLAFVEGQKNLLTITEMLSAANFDLNQARIDETDTVYKMSQALAQFSTSVEAMEESFDFIIGDDFLSSIVETSVNNAKQLYSHLTDAELIPILAEVENSARSAAQGFIDMVESMNSTIGGSTGDSSGTVQVGSLTDRFKDFNVDLIKYLDQEGLAVFYGPGGVFENFRDALHTTLVLEGFDALTMPGGPLENFNTYLHLTGKTIDDLVSSNAVLNLEFEKIETALGPMIVALGETEDQLSVLSYALYITGDTLGSAQAGVEDINTAFGLLSLGVSDSQMGRTLSILSNDIPSSIDTLHQNVFLFQAVLEDLNITNSMDEAVTNINTNIGLLETTLTNINIANIVDNVGDVITSSFEDLGISSSSSMQTFVNRFKSDIEDTSNPDSLAYFLYNLDLSGALSNATSILSQVTTSTADSVDALIAVFSDNNNDKIRNVVKSLSSLNEIVTAINDEEGLNAMLREFDSVANDTAGNISLLTANAVALRDELSNLLGSDGTLVGIKAAFTNIAQDFAYAWDTFRTNIDLTSPNFTVYSEIRGEPALSTADKSNLMQIATNTSVFPRIVGATYDYITPSGVRPGYASGGLVEGPGSSTSDSIAADLSNGEYVINAQSTKALGSRMMEYLNSFGRRGDTMLAHINPAEANLLQMLGGAGTKNPMTGLREYYPDAGAIGNMFSGEEAALLWKTYNKDFMQSEPGTNSSGGDLYILEYLRNISNYSGSPETRTAGSIWNRRPEGKAELRKWTTALAYMANELLDARAMDPLTSLENSFGMDFRKSRGLRGPKYYRQAKRTVLEGIGGDSSFKFPYPDAASEQRFSYKGSPLQKTNPPMAARTGQVLSGISGANISMAKPDRDHIKAAIDALNAERVFTDFYMLQPTNSRRPSAQYLTTGGLVDKEFANSVMRDSVDAKLEPGEFVLKKPAVDKIGLAELYNLNATGNMDNDIVVEVNVINNGTNQEVISQEMRRREDGKIIVDVMLEDLRTNGPISRKIKTMRK